MIQFEWKHTVEWGECDPARIVFYPNIYRWFDKSSLDMMRCHGFGQAEMIEQYGIIGFPLIETHAQYKRPMRWNDEVVVSSCVDSYSGRSFTVTHRVFKSDVLCVVGYEIRCWGTRDGETGKMKASEMPDEFVRAIG